MLGQMERSVHLFQLFLVLVILNLGIQGVHAGCEDVVFMNPVYVTCMLAVYEISTNSTIFFPYYVCGVGQDDAQCALDAVTPCPAAIYALPLGYETPYILGSTLTEIVVNWTSIVPYCNGTICSENWEQEKLVFDCVRALESTGLDAEDNAVYFCGAGNVDFRCAVTGFRGCNPLLDMNVSYILDVFHPNVSRGSLLADGGVESTCLAFMTSTSIAMSTSTSTPTSALISTSAVLNMTITPVNSETKNLAQCSQVPLCFYLPCVGLMMMLL